MNCVEEDEPGAIDLGKLVDSRVARTSSEAGEVLRRNRRSTSVEASPVREDPRACLGPPRHQDEQRLSDCVYSEQLIPTRTQEEERSQQGWPRLRLVEPARNGAYP